MPMYTKQRAQYAHEHTDYMNEKYSQEIKKCIEETKVYSPDHDFSLDTSHSSQETIYEVADADSVSALFNDDTLGKVALLNFASFINPGGGFIDGSNAQEECLCQESFLYNVLLQMKGYYQWNRDHENRSLYLNRGLYSPDVVFEHDNKVKNCDVITVAAPFKRKAVKQKRVKESENSEALDSRIKFILDIAKENNVDTLILGAFGCGVFGQDPNEVSHLFKQYLDAYSFKKVLFPIPSSKRNDNYEVFASLFDS